MNEYLDLLVEILVLGFFLVLVCGFLGFVLVFFWVVFLLQEQTFYLDSYVLLKSPALPCVLKCRTQLWIT